MKRAANEVGTANAPLIELILRRELDVLGVHVHLVDGGGPLASDGHRGCRLVGSRAPGAPERRPAEPAAHTTAHARAPGAAFAPARDAPRGGRAPFVLAQALAVILPSPAAAPPPRARRPRSPRRPRSSCLLAARPVLRTSRESSRECPPKTASVAVRASVSDAPAATGVKQLRLARHRGAGQTLVRRGRPWSLAERGSPAGFYVES